MVERDRFMHPQTMLNAFSSEPKHGQQDFFVRDTKLRSSTPCLRFAAFLINHQKDFQPLFVGERLKYFCVVRLFHDRRIIIFKSLSILFFITFPTLIFDDTVNSAAWTTTLCRRLEAQRHSREIREPPREDHRPQRFVSSAASCIPFRGGIYPFMLPVCLSFA